MAVLRETDGGHVIAGAAQVAKLLPGGPVV
jgi:hypothetical protein